MQGARGCPCGRAARYDSGIAQGGRIGGWPASEGAGKWGGLAL